MTFVSEGKTSNKSDAEYSILIVSQRVCGARELLKSLDKSDGAMRLMSVENSLPSSNATRRVDCTLRLPSRKVTVAPAGRPNIAFQE